MVPHACTATRQHRAFSIVGPSVWNNLPPTCVLFRMTCLALFINFLRFSSLTGLGSGAPLSSYLEGALI